MKPMVELLASARRELALRRRVYPRWVESGRISEDQAAHEIQCMSDICEVLELRKVLAEVTEELRAESVRQQEQNKSGIVYDSCPHCHGSFSFRAPIGAHCGWCGKQL